MSPKATVLSAAHPVRRGPRPLALHIAHAEWAWRAGEPHRLAAFYRGVEAYRRHPYRREVRRPPTAWEYGGCGLIDYGAYGERESDGGWPLLVVPSLVNRAYILDLMPGASLLGFLHGKGIRPFLLDWGEDTAADRQLTLDRLILERMIPAFDWLYRTTGKRPLVLGYCMGGTLATALACLCQERMAGLALLAAPWHFDRGDHSIARTTSYQGALASLTNQIGSAPVDFLQTLFAQVDPLNVPKKFARFAGVTPTSRTARRFVALEDWLNDGVPLNAEVAAECLLDWYGSNAPAMGGWRVNGDRVNPDQLNLPVCLAIPQRDRIVPPDSALALADILPGCELIRPNAGHVGMVVGRNAETSLWDPLAQWLTHVAATQKV